MTKTQFNALCFLWLGVHVALLIGGLISINTELAQNETLSGRIANTLEVTSSDPIALHNGTGKCCEGSDLVVTQQIKTGVVMLRRSLKLHGKTAVSQLIVQQSCSSVLSVSFLRASVPEVEHHETPADRRVLVSLKEISDQTWLPLTAVVSVF